MRKEFKTTVTVKEALEISNAQFIDMRSPCEFIDSTIPDAINLPLFSDDERAKVGITYKHKGQKHAVLEGISYFAPKLPDYMKQIAELRKKHKVIIFCARGGLRSKAISDLCNNTGFHVFQLEGGYKAYRKHITTSLHNWTAKKPVFVLDGLTGTGKTRIINLMKYSLDLEGLACHRSSLLGCIGLKPVSQKMFDSLLYGKLIELEPAPYIIVEGESRKIGEVMMPDSLYKAILKGTHVRVEASLKKRVKYLKEDYTNVDPEEIKPRIEKLTKRLSKKEISELNALVDEKKYDEVIPVLLEKYYDPLYRHTIDKKDYKSEVNNDCPEKAAKELKKYIDSVL